VNTLVEFTIKRVPMLKHYYA